MKDIAADECRVSWNHGVPEPERSAPSDAAILPLSYLKLLKKNVDWHAVADSASPAQEKMLQLLQSLHRVKSSTSNSPNLTAMTGTRL